MGSCCSTDENDVLIHNSFDDDYVSKVLVNKSNLHTKKLGSNELCIILMGDSVLDDFYWLTDNRLDIEQQLKNSFNSKNIQIKNFAVDESQTYHILNGIRPNPTYVQSRKKYHMNNYPNANDCQLIAYAENEQKTNEQKDDIWKYVGNDSKIQGNKVYPLLLLHKYINNESNRASSTYVVLSIGGNDARVHLGKLATPSGNAATVIDALKNVENSNRGSLQENYLSIIDIMVNDLQLQNTILLLPYQIGGSYIIYNSKNKVNELLTVMDYGMQCISEIAYKYRLPIIDLSRTFMVNNPRHYGSTPIEPSNISGQFIVDLIQYVLATFDFNNEERISWVYSGTKSTEFVIEENNGLFRSTYLKLLKSRNEKMNLI